MIAPTTPFMFPANTLGNRLLEDPAIKSYQEKCFAIQGETIAWISIVAFAALSVGSLYWVSIIAVEFSPVILATATLLFPMLHSVAFHPGRLKAISHWEIAHFEDSVAQHIQQIETAYQGHTHPANPPGQAQQYLRWLHQHIGANDLSPQLESHLIRTTQKTHAQAALIPLYGRVLAYREQAQKKFDEMNIILLKPISPSESNGADLRYEGMLNMWNNPATLPGDRASLNGRLTLYEAAMEKLQGEILKYQMHAVQVAAIASSPLHSGDPIGISNTLCDPSIDLLQQRYRDNPTTNPFFQFHRSLRGIGRDKIESINNQHLHETTLYSLARLIDNKQIDIDFALPSTEQNGEFYGWFSKEVSKFENDPLTPILFEDQWATIDKHILDWVKRFIHKGPDGFRLADVILNLNRHLTNQALANIAPLNAVVQTKSTRTLSKIVHEEDMKSFEARILKALLALLPIYDLSIQPHMIPEPLQVEGSTQADVLRELKLPADLTFQHSDFFGLKDLIIKGEKFAGTVPTNLNLFLDPYSKARTALVAQRYYATNR